MENLYGIGVANRYALFLDDESDPLETLSLKELEKDSKKKNKVAEKENKVKSEPLSKGKTAPAPKKIIKDNNRDQENKREDVKSSQRSIVDNKQDREKNSNKYNNENREERNNRRNREDKPFNGHFENRSNEEKPKREPTGETFESRNRDRGRDGRAIGNKPTGLRGPRKNFEERRGKREFDRQSGSDKTGVKPIDKREGAGAHNWGSHKDDIEEADRPNNDINQNWGDDSKVEAVDEKKEEVDVETTPIEEEPKELTLDEWKAQRAGRVKPQYNIRKAGEGEDPSQWKKMFELRKKEKEEESEEEEYDISEYPQRVGRQKHILDIDIQFNDSRRLGVGRGRGQRSGPRGTRGGRGGGRDGGRDGMGFKDGTRDNVREGGRDGGRDSARDLGRESSGQAEDRNDDRQAPKVDDERDFPSLG